MDDRFESSADSKSISDLKFISYKLDSQFALPLGLRIGWDGILGFIPGVGDVITTSFALYILIRAAILGAPPSIIGRMGINILIESAADIIPVLGNLFDILWKANNKNVRLLENYLLSPTKATWTSRAVVLVFVLFLAAVIAGFFVLAIMLALEIWEFLF